MIHGGNEYDPAPSTTVARLSHAARQAGAVLVINHHPHVVGGLDWDGASLVTWTLGNLLFDQTIWPTFASYLLTVHLRDGEVVWSYTEPLIIQEYTPDGVVGHFADHVARVAAGYDPSSFYIEDGSAVLNPTVDAPTQQLLMSVTNGSAEGTIFRLDEGSWVTERCAKGAIC